MHMADALLSPAVGGTLWAATAAGVAYCSKRVRQEMDDKKVPLMGVLGAFIFAAQMINFAIPGTGSSGHLGGGMILAILLGPCPAFLVMASVLTVQALFFADGGLLALGANIFNLGAFPCFVAYPLVFVPLAGRRPSKRRLVLASVLAAVVGLQFGAAGVVIETVASDVSELPFSSFLLLMLPIHAAIGVVEGVITAAVVSFVGKAQPDVLPGAPGNGSSSGARPRVLVGVVFAAVLLGGLVSWFASSRPDGLEWAIGRITGSGEVQGPSGPVHSVLEEWQKRVAVLPGYGFPSHEQEPGTTQVVRADPGASVAGLVGGLLTLLVAGATGIILHRRRGSAPAR